MDIYYMDGEFVPADQAVVSVNDMVVLRGYGVFDFLRTYNRRPFHLKEHIARLRRSAEAITLAMGWSDDEIYDIVMKTIEKNPHHKESHVRMIVTGGIGRDFVTPRENQKLLVLVTPAPEFPASWYSQGVKIITGRDERSMPGIKSTNYLTAIVALKKAKEVHAVESVYVDKEGRVLEGTTTNIFLFEGCRLVTPDTGILPGITRKVVLDILRDRFDIEIRDVTKEELILADEVFITASNKEVVPVVQVDERIVSGGRVGHRTRKVMELFRAYTTRYGLENA